MLAAITATVPDQVPTPPARRRRRLARDRPDARRGRRVRHRRGDGQHRGGLPRRLAGVLVRAARCRTASTAATSPSTPRTASRSCSAAFVRSFWVSPRAAPRLRVGLDHPLPDEPRQRAAAALPPLLPQGRGRPDRRRGRGRRLRADRDLRRVHGAHRGRRRHLVRPARPAQGLRDRLRPGRRDGAAAARVRHHLDRRRHRRRACSASATASTPRSTSR